MTKRHRKALLTAVKIAIAAVLLWVVLRQVHWHDYVVTGDGKAVRAVRLIGPADAPTGVLVRGGDGVGADDEREMPLDQLDPVEGATGRAKYIRLGVRQSLLDMNIWLALAGVGTFALTQVAVGIRWWRLLKVQDVTLTIWEALRLTLLGLFFNNAVPGTVGGDLFKMYYAARHAPRKAGVVVSVLIDRMVGLMEFTLMAAVMLAVVFLVGLAPREQLMWPAVAVAALLVVLPMGGAFVISSRFRRALRLQALYRRLPIAHHLSAAGEASHRYRRQPGKLLEALGISVIAHVLLVSSAVLLGAAIGLDVPWYSYFLYIPLIYAIGAVPITPGGIGLIEKLYIVFFAANPSMVLVVALGMRMLPIVVGLPGLFVFLAGPRPPKADAIEQQLEQADAPAPSEPVGP